MDDEIQLPGGLRTADHLVRKVTLREISGWEEDILTDQRKAKDGSGRLLRRPGDRITDVLARCTVKVGEDICEANADPEKASVKHFHDIWDAARSGDRGVAVVTLRRLSLGDKYIFTEICPHCKREMPRVSVDLSTQEISPYFSNLLFEADGKEAGEDAEARETVNELLMRTDYEVTTPKGTCIRWKHATRMEEERMQELMTSDPASIVSASILTRVTHINGKEAKLKSTKSLYSSDRTFLRRYFDEVDGGIDTTAEISCDNLDCGATYSRRIDIGKPSFFFPSGA